MEIQDTLLNWDEKTHLHSTEFRTAPPQNNPAVLCRYPPENASAHRHTEVR